MTLGSTGTTWYKLKPLFFLHLTFAKIIKYAEGATPARTLTISGLKSRVLKLPFLT